jgi:hypothetical protein
MRPIEWSTTAGGVVLNIQTAINIDTLVSTLDDGALGESSAQVVAAVEALVHGRSVEEVDPDIARCARAALKAIRGLDVVAVGEQIVTQGLPIPVAGTRDLLLKVSGGRHYVAAIKTVDSTWGMHCDPVTWATRLACLARGGVYPDTLAFDASGTTQVDMDECKFDDREPSPTRGIVIEVARGSDRYERQAVDLTMGWKVARLACALVEARR